MDWLQFAPEDVPCGEPAYVLIGALSHSGRFRGAFCEQMTFGRLADAMHRVLVALGGTPRVWRTDRMATIVVSGTDWNSQPHTGHPRSFGYSAHGEASVRQDGGQEEPLGQARRVPRRRHRKRGRRLELL